jgi:hypothetical protein
MEEMSNARLVAALEAAALSLGGALVIGTDDTERRHVRLAALRNEVLSRMAPMAPEFADAQSQCRPAPVEGY